MIGTSKERPIEVQAKTRRDHIRKRNRRHLDAIQQRVPLLESLGVGRNIEKGLPIVAQHKVVILAEGVNNPRCNVSEIELHMRSNKNIDFAASTKQASPTSTKPAEERTVIVRTTVAFVKIAP